LVKRVTRREKTRKRRYVERTQRQQQQRQLQREVEETIRQALREAFEQALRDEVTALLGRAKSERRDPTDSTVVEARRNKCGTRYRYRFSRDGFYERSVLSVDACVTQLVG